MKGLFARVVVSGVWLAGVMLALSGQAYAETVSTVTRMNGVVTLIRDGKPRLISMNSKIAEGDIIETTAGSYVQLQTPDQGTITVVPSSQMTIKAFDKAEDGNVLIGLLKGGLRSVTGLMTPKRKERWKLETPTATIGIRGTKFGAAICEETTGEKTSDTPTACEELAPKDARLKEGLYLDVSEGEIVASNGGGETVFSKDSFGFVQSKSTKAVSISSTEGFVIKVPETAKSPFDPDDQGMYSEPLSCQ